MGPRGQWWKGHGGTPARIALLPLGPVPPSPGSQLSSCNPLSVSDAGRVEGLLPGVKREACSSAARRSTVGQPSTLAGKSRASPRTRMLDLYVLTCENLARQRHRSARCPTGVWRWLPPRHVSGGARAGELPCGVAGGHPWSCWIFPASDAQCVAIRHERPSRHTRLRTYPRWLRRPKYYLRHAFAIALSMPRSLLAARVGLVIARVAPPWYPMVPRCQPGRPVTRCPSPLQGRRCGSDRNSASGCVRLAKRTPCVYCGGRNSRSIHSGATTLNKTPIRHRWPGGDVLVKSVVCRRGGR